MDAAQSWFWTPEWQAGEREAEQDLVAGRVETFQSCDELLSALEKAQRSQ